MEKLIRDCHDTVRPGGTVAILIQNTTEMGGEMSRMGRYYADHVLDGYNFFIKTGFNPVQRINIPLTWEQFAGFDIKEAREKKRLLGVVRDLLIMKKGRQSEEIGLWWSLQLVLKEHRLRTNIQHCPGNQARHERAVSKNYSFDLYLFGN
jgi:hypothetical protein